MDAGSGKADRMAGDGKANVFQGNGGKDVLTGRGGADKLEGGAGNDQLNGGPGKDVFIFDTAAGRANLDRITDFNVVADTIRLDRSVYDQLATGRLAAQAFTIGAAAKDADDRIVYKGKTGMLLYNADGAGGTAAVQIAQLSAGLKLTAADFDVIL